MQPSSKAPDTDAEIEYEGRHRAPEPPPELTRTADLRGEHAYRDLAQWWRPRLRGEDDD